MVSGDGKSVQTKLMSELKVNDQVLVADEEDTVNSKQVSESTLKFSKVVSFLHMIEEIDADFIRLHYEAVDTSTHESQHGEFVISSSNRTRSVIEVSQVKKTFISLTPKHLILAAQATNETATNETNAGSMSWYKMRSAFNYVPAETVEKGDLLRYYDYNLKIYRLVRVINKEKLNLKGVGIYAPLTETGTIIVDNIHVSCYSLVKNHKLAQLFYSILNHLSNLIKITSESYLTYSKFFFDFLNYIQMSDFFLNI